MNKIAAFIGASLILLIPGKTVLAQEAQAEGRPVCEAAQKLAQSPDGAEQTVRGMVRSIVGDMVTLELADGEVRTVYLDRRERGFIGNILGADVVVTPVFCNRVSLYREAPPPARAFNIPSLPPPQPAPSLPPLNPPPPPPPPPAPLLPQTW
ncbi:hypothetical protein [Roseofilum capinflatum]|uniref:PRC-barrel domain-containing protein n=1 Tax=Roseofilum capinflatum BLCC-M114 TaxID=3022440 RepID=A0ABT7B0Y3_9CYAN|nr:hypothetical protein [Roseofilum capinflatum]MDJ1172829.1 hypothetical protein [Roseofilum capinflatum BLCC-M114]